MDVQNLKYGDKLPNGATVIRFVSIGAATRTVYFVMAWTGRDADDKNNFATWEMDSEGNTFWGHYFHNDFEGAYADFEDRRRGVRGGAR